MKRLLVVLAAFFLVAATPSEVVPGLESDGFFIEQGSSASPDVVGDAVAEAGLDGGRLYIVVLSEEPSSGATFFSGAVFDELGAGTVLTVAPETVGYESDGATWSQSELDDAVDASLSGSSDDDVVALFIESLTGTTPSSGGSGSGGTTGGGNGWIWFLVIGGGFFLLFLYLRSRSNRTAATARAGRLAEFREAAQEKLAAVANDILEMEDEVRLSENPEIQGHFNSASAKYAELVDAVGKESDPEKLLSLTHQLDLAIWELDVAEAMLDGKPVPEKPQPPKIEAPAPETPQPTPPVITQPTRPDFDRRPQRQSTPAGPDLGNILLAILAAQSLGGRRGGPGGWTGAPTGGGWGGSSGGGFRGGGSRGGGRFRGGGRRRG